MFVFETDIYVEDVDFGGIVYHANYLKYAERARTMWLKSFGYPLQSLLHDNITFVIRKAALEYLAPARLSDRIAVASTLIDHGRSSMHVSQKIHKITGDAFKPDSDPLLCQITVQVVCVDRSIKPISIPKTILEGFKS